MPRDYNRPTSKWMYSHALTKGDELTDTWQDTALTVVKVHNNGAVEMRVWMNERHESPYVKETYQEDVITHSLVDGIMETVDGLSHELASF